MYLVSVIFSDKKNLTKHSNLVMKNFQKYQIASTIIHW
jgi:hypothetical protein